MLSTLSRTPRRLAALGGLAIVIIIMGLFMLKDMNEKLGVMTASNAAYQRMTDSQSDKIKQLQASLKEEESEHRASKLRCSEKARETDNQLDQDTKNLQKIQSELASVKSKHEHLQAEMDRLSKANVDSSHRMSRLTTELEKCSTGSQTLQAENDHMKAQLAQLSRDINTYKSQYSALFKQHQANSDSLTELQNEKQRLQLQLNDARNVKSLQHSSQRSTQSKKVLHQPIVAGPNGSSSTAKAGLLAAPAPGHNMAQIQQPRLAPGAASSSSSTSTESPHNGGQGAPVGAEPPVGPDAAGQQHMEQLEEHQVQREDVMEAPHFQHDVAHHQGQQEFNRYFHQGFIDDSDDQHHQQQQQQAMFQVPPQHHFVMPNGRREIEDNADSGLPQRNNLGGGADNLDRQIDGVQQDRPELREEEEDDETDGEIRLEHHIPPMLQRGQQAHLGAQGMEQEDEDDLAGEAIEDDDVVYNAVHGVGALGGHGQNRFKPEDFGIHQVNFEPNQLKRYVQPVYPVRYAAGHNGMNWEM